MNEPSASGVMSPKLRRELRFLISAHPRSESSDRPLRSLLEQPLFLDELIFCRCQVYHPHIAHIIEERLLHHPFSDIPAMGDLVTICTELLDDRLQEKLHTFCAWLVTGSGYCHYLWAIAKQYPDLREDVGTRFLREDFPEIPQVAYTMKYVPPELQDALTKKVESYGNPLYMDVFYDRSYA